jgi:hypothetical protein
MIAIDIGELNIKSAYAWIIELSWKGFFSIQIDEDNWIAKQAEHETHTDAE